MEDGEPLLSGYRKKIAPATQAALWTLSNGRCYAPGCQFPVVFEIKPGVYQKNAQVAHIHGVRAPRFNPDMTPEQCAEFSNLLLLCLAHHSGVDDKRDGERLYPAELLREWKAEHEGSNGPALAALGAVDEDSLTELLLDVFSPPLERLEQIADRLEGTGTLNAQTVEELRQVVDVMTSSPSGPDARTAAWLAEAAEVYGSHRFRNTVLALVEAAALLPGNGSALDSKISELHEIADLISASSRRMSRYE